MTWGQMKEIAANLNIPDSAPVEFDDGDAISKGRRRIRVRSNAMTAYFKSDEVRDRSVAKWSEEQQKAAKSRVVFLIGTSASDARWKRSCG